MAKGASCVAKEIVITNPQRSDISEKRNDGDYANASGIHMVPVQTVVPGDSPRLSGIDETHVIQLAECAAELPPIVVHRKTMRVIDGNHRLQAAIRSGREHVKVTFFGGDENESFILAVELNAKHGLPLSLSDRKAAAHRILANGADLSDRAIALKIGLSDKTVAAIRIRAGAEIPHPNGRRGRDGRLYPTDGAEGRQRVAQLIAERPRASLREIALAAGVSPATVSSVRKRQAQGEDAASGQARPDADEKTEGAPTSSSALNSPGRRAERTRNSAWDRRVALEQLRSDPSIRSKEAGRDLLRWLFVHAIDTCDLPDGVDSIPVHRVELIAALARETAHAWHEFARRIESSVQPGTL